jgi:hypothetical protein
VRDIDTLIQSMNAIYPTVRVRQLEVSHPGADDDGLWFFQESNSEAEVQVESSTGMCPFLVETDGSDVQFAVTSVDQAVETLARLLRLGK